MAVANLHYRVYGEGRPVVVLHGLFGSLSNWGGVSRALAEHFRVLAVDLRNHGRSEHCSSMTYSEMAEDVLALCRSLDIRKTSFIGHSMGGKVAMTIASRLPQQVDKLVIEDIAPRQYGSRHRNIISAMKAVDLAECSSRQEVDQRLAGMIPLPAVRQFLLTNIKTGPDGALQWRLNLDSISDFYGDIMGAVELDSAFDGPVLLVRGGHSDYVSDADVQDMKQVFSNLRAIQVPGAGHWVHAEAPAAFLEAVLNFLTAG